MGWDGPSGLFIDLIIGLPFQQALTCLCLLSSPHKVSCRRQDKIGCLIELGLLPTIDSVTDLRLSAKSPVYW